MTSQHTLRSTTLAILVLLCVVTSIGVVSAATSNGPLAVAVTDQTVTAGENATISFRIENTGSSTLTGTAVELSVPDDWTVVDHTTAGGTFKTADRAWLWLSLPAGETKRPSLTVQVPEDASGQATAQIRATDSANHSATEAVNIQVDDAAEDVADNSNPTAANGHDNSDDDSSNAAVNGGHTTARASDEYADDVSSNSGSTGASSSSNEERSSSYGASSATDGPADDAAEASVGAKSGSSAVNNSTHNASNAAVNATSDAANVSTSSDEVPTVGVEITAERRSNDGRRAVDVPAQFEPEHDPDNGKSNATTATNAQPRNSSADFSSDEQTNETGATGLNETAENGSAVTFVADAVVFAIEQLSGFF
jgi:hypothetical protein